MIPITATSEKRNDFARLLKAFMHESATPDDASSFDLAARIFAEEHQLFPSEQDIKQCASCPSIGSGDRLCQHLLSGLFAKDGIITLCCFCKHRFLLPKDGNAEDSLLTVLKMECFRHFLKQEFLTPGLSSQNRYPKKISDVGLSLLERCNLECIYCHTNRGKNNLADDRHLLGLIHILEELDCVDRDFTFEIAGREPLLSSCFKEILAFILTRNPSKGMIYSNCTVFSQSVLAAIQSGKLCLITSIDSGTRETYKTVKNNDLFDIAMVNIERYSKARKENVLVKYIVLPENSHMGELESFVRHMARIGVPKVLIAGNMAQTGDPYILQTLLRLQKMLRENNIEALWNTITIRCTQEEAEKKVAAAGLDFCCQRQESGDS